MANNFFWDLFEHSGNINAYLAYRAESTDDAQLLDYFNCYSENQLEYENGYENDKPL